MADVMSRSGGTAAAAVARPERAPAAFAVSVATDLSAIEAEWRALEQQAGASAYQSFDFLDTWVRHAAPPQGIEPCIGVVRSPAGAVKAILPFGRRARGGSASAAYLGGTHANINMPLFDPAFARTLDQAGLSRLLADYCRAARVDLLTLRYQPESWLGTPHPFASLSRQVSPDPVRRIEIAAGYEAFFKDQLSGEARKKLRSKLQRVTKEGACFTGRIRESREIERLLGIFQAQKGQRLKAMGADDPFAKRGVGDFLREAAQRSAACEDGLALYAVTAGEAVVALRGVLRRGPQMSMLMQSFDAEHPLAKYSLGELLMAHVIEQAAGEGVGHFDFGVGEARYKDTWSNAVTPMFDSVFAGTAKGHAAAGLVRARVAATRAIKQNRRVYGWLKAARARLAAIRS